MLHPDTVPADGTTARSLWTDGKTSSVASLSENCNPDLENPHVNFFFHQFAKLTHMTLDGIEIKIGDLLWQLLLSLESFPPGRGALGLL